MEYKQNNVQCTKDKHTLFQYLRNTSCIKMARRYIRQIYRVLVGVTKT